MDQWDVAQGSQLTIDVTLRDGSGNPITVYDGTQTLASTLSPGWLFASVASPATTWVTPSAGLIAVTLSNAQTTALAQGKYYLRTRLTDGTALVDAYEAAITIKPSPGSASFPATYTSYTDLLNYGKAWLRQLQTADDGAGFIVEQGRARSWLEDCAHAHFRVASMVMMVGGQGVGPRRSGARSVYLTQQLAANTLMITDQVKEAVSKKALAFICESQLDGSDGSARFAKLARMYHSQADYLATTIVIQLDTNGDGYSDITIDLSCTDPMFG